jgi:hypothetical protein
MSFQALTWATEQNIPAMQKIVLLMMANRFNHDTGLCCPSHDLLAKECGMTKRSLIDQLSKLEQAGYIKVIRSTNDKGMKKVNRYVLLFNKLGSEPHSLGSEGDSLVGSATDSLGSEPHSLGGSESRSHKPVNIKPVKEPVKKICIEDDDDLTIKQLIEFKPDQVDCKLWESTLKARKKRKAVQSRRAINGFIGELEKCEQGGVSMTTALDTFLQKSWKGMEAEWILQKQKSPGSATNRNQGHIGNQPTRRTIAHDDFNSKDYGQSTFELPWESTAA